MSTSGRIKSRPWTVDEALAWGRERLAGTDEPDWAAKMLLAHVPGCTLSELFMYPERRLCEAEAAAYRSLVERRTRHEPVAYLVGRRGFLDLDLLVDSRVLIPRPETELLVERALCLARRWTRPRIADVGTGSGAIAIGLAVALPQGKLPQAELPQAELLQAAIYALDSSPGALEVARKNADRNGVAGRITFLEGDLLAPLPAERTAVDLIVANLPYVAEDEYASLPPGIRLYEPRAALVAGPDGLDAIRRLLRTAPPYLNPGGAILLEIGAAQGDAVSALAADAFPGARIEVIADYGGRDRVVEIDTQVTQSCTEDTQREGERKTEGE
jgi:release factor glutamine methyltransferase